MPPPPRAAKLPSTETLCMTTEPCSTLSPPPRPSLVDSRRTQLSSVGLASPVVFEMRTAESPAARSTVKPSSELAPS
eukprot:6079608-Prymnesium_polylepis.1